MKKMSMLEFRRNTRKALAWLRRGERFVLTYRGKPIARLEPIRESGDVPEDDPLLRVGDFAVDGPTEALTNEQVDRLLYGSERS